MRRALFGYIFAFTAGLAAALPCCAAQGQEAAAPSPARTPSALVAAPPMAPVMSILPDGAHLVVLPDPSATETVVDIFFQVGQSDEGRWPGINALITRSWVSASNNRSAPLLQLDIERNGGAIGTASGPDWTELWGACAPDDASFARLGQTLLTNLVSTPLFGESAVASGRTDQLRALTMRPENLVADVMDRMQSQAYGDTPYALPLLGTSQSIAAVPWTQVGAYYRRYFRPERAVIVVCGRVTAADARERIAASIGAGGWDDATPLHGPREQLAAVLPIPSGLHEKTVARHAPAVCVAVGYIAPGTNSRTGRADYSTLLVLDAVLGGGKASRLFGLRDRVSTNGSTPIGYEIRSVLLAGRAQSLWCAYVIGTRPPAEIEKPLFEALHSLADGSGPIGEAEITRAKTYLKARHLEDRERIKDRAYGVGWSDAMGLGTDFDTGYEGLIDAVTASDLAELARKVFSGNAAVAHSLPAVVAAVP